MTDDISFGNEGWAETRRQREEWEAGSVGPVESYGVAGIPGLGAVPIFKIRKDIRAELSDRARDHEFQWVVFKESDEWTSEYTSFGLTVTWAQPSLTIRLFFPVTEFRTPLKLIIDHGMIGLAPEGLLKAERTVLLSVPDPEIIAGTMAALGAT